MRVSRVLRTAGSQQRRGIPSGILYPMRIRDLTRFGFTDVLFPEGSVAPDD